MRTFPEATDWCIRRYFGGINRKRIEWVYGGKADKIQMKDYSNADKNEEKISTRRSAHLPAATTGTKGHAVRAADGEVLLARCGRSCGGIPCRGR